MAATIGEKLYRYTTMTTHNQSDFAVALFDAGLLHFGEFTLRSGSQSPVYVDFRLLCAFPQLLARAAHAIAAVLKEQSVAYDVICGVPYSALPIATALSLHTDIPMIFRRKESKSYGMKKDIEGHYVSGQRALIVEDLITAGGSIRETADALQSAGLVVDNAIVLLDREQGGSKKLSASGITVHSVLTFTNVLDTLSLQKRITPETAATVRTYLANNRVT